MRYELVGRGHRAPRKRDSEPPRRSRSWRTMELDVMQQGARSARQKPMPSLVYCGSDKGSLSNSGVAKLPIPWTCARLRVDRHFSVALIDVLMGLPLAV